MQPLTCCGSPSVNGSLVATWNMICLPWKEVTTALSPVWPWDTSRPPLNLNEEWCEPASWDGIMWWSYWSFEVKTQAMHFPVTPWIPEVGPSPPRRTGILETPHSPWCCSVCPPPWSKHKVTFPSRRAQSVHAAILQNGFLKVFWKIYLPFFLEQDAKFEIGRHPVLIKCYYQPRGLGIQWQMRSAGETQRE